MSWVNDNIPIVGGAGSLLVIILGWLGYRTFKKKKPEEIHPEDFIISDDIDESPESAIIPEVLDEVQSDEAWLDNIDDAAAVPTSHDDESEMIHGATDDGSSVPKEWYDLEETTSESSDTLSAHDSVHSEDDNSDWLEAADEVNNVSLEKEISDEVIFDSEVMKEESSEVLHTVEDSIHDEVSENIDSIEFDFLDDTNVSESDEGELVVSAPSDSIDNVLEDDAIDSNEEDDLLITFDFNDENADKSSEEVSLADDLSDDNDSIDVLEFELDDSSSQSESSSETDDVELDEQQLTESDISFDIDVDNAPAEVVETSEIEINVSSSDDMISFDLNDYQDTQSNSELVEALSDESTKDDIVVSSRGHVSPETEARLKMKLDLADSYKAIGSSDRAKELLKEVVEKGTDEQMQQAQATLDELS